MPKMLAPHGASWRGRVLAAGDIIDVSDVEAFQLGVHGFTLIEDSGADDSDIGERGESASAAPDFATMARKNLLKFLGGRGLGNLFPRPTEELRALAIDICDGKLHAPKEPEDGGE
jgi:hypothetical protein